MNTYLAHRVRAFFIAVSMLAIAANSLWALPFPDPSWFGEPVPVSGLTLNDNSLSLTPDGQHMLFGRGGPHQVYSADWNTSIGSWTNIQHVELGPGGGSYDSAPCLSLDGQSLFYVGSNGSTGDIYRSLRLPDGSWSQGQLVGLGKTTVNGNSNPFFDGNRLYFTRYTAPSGYEIAYAPYNPGSDSFGTPVLLNSINSAPSYDNSARVFGDGKTLLWSSNRTGTSGANDTWMASWNSTQGDWTDIRNPDWTIKSSGSDAVTWYCESTRTLYFSRDGQPLQATAAPPPSTHVLCVGVLDDATSSGGSVIAERVRDAFDSFRSVDNIELLPLDSTSSDNLATLQAKIIEMKGLMRAGDTFVFYMASHGNQPLDGDEPPVDRQVRDSSGWISPTRVEYRGDENTLLSRNWNQGEGRWNYEFISDDDFTSLFTGSDWDAVDKLFLMDQCWAGGFWGDPASADGGDLAKLARAALIAASAEGDFSLADRDHDLDLDITRFGRALELALRSLSDRDAITYQELYDAIELEGATLAGVPGRIAGFEEEWGAEADLPFALSGASTADFGLTLGVPEPATLSLLALGGLLLLRRRRR